MYKIVSKWPHQNSIHVEWNLGKRCNLDCTYCPSEIHDNYSPHTPISTLLSTIDKLSVLGKPIRLSLTGGEPCVHPDIEDLLLECNKKLDWVNVTTNATRDPQWYIRQLVSHYVFSLHFESANWERCINNICTFAQLNEEQDRIPFHVNVMAHHNHMDRVKLAVSRFHGLGVRYAIRRIRWTEKHDWFDDMRYNQNDLDWILKHDATALPNCIIDDNQYLHANDIIKQKLNQFKGWTCNAGLESLMINWDGEVHRATCRVGGSLGNIYEGTFVVPSEPVICTRDWCTCAADIPLTKYDRN